MLEQPADEPGVGRRCRERHRRRRGAHELDGAGGDVGGEHTARVRQLRLGDVAAEHAQLGPARAQQPRLGADAHADLEERADAVERHAVEHPGRQELGLHDQPFGFLVGVAVDVAGYVTHANAM